MSTTTTSEIYKVTVVGEPLPTSGESSVPTCCSAAVTTMLFPGTNVGTDGTDIGNDGRDVSNDGLDAEELLSLNGVGSDALIAVTTGEMIERAGVDAGVVSLEVSTTGPEPSSE